jgi:hypothetical protein
VFTKAATSSKISLPKAQSREELAAALSGMDSADADILRMEVDTMEEDWLLALQDELTKPYFTNVRLVLVGPLQCRRPGRTWAHFQLKRFVTAEQKSKKIFPPGEIFGQALGVPAECSLRRVPMVDLVSAERRAGGDRRYVTCRAMEFQLMLQVKIHTMWVEGQTRVYVS